MIYGKLENGNIIRAPKGIETPEGVWIIPPSAKMLIEMGFKPVIYTPRPDAKEGFYFVASWQENKKEIRQVWTEQTEQTEPEYTIEERTQILEDTMAEVISMLGGGE